MEKLILFGCGVETEKFIKRNSNEKIICCIDDNLATASFGGYKVYKSSELMNVRSDHGGIVLIFTRNVKAYSLISKQLKKLGLTEFEDYLPAHLYKKKIALAWGNCHALYIKAFLSYSKEFSDKYAFYDTKNLWDMKEKDLDLNLLKHCDLLVSQHIREDNKVGSFASSDSIEKYIKPECIVLKFPNLFGLPKFLFPQSSIDDMYTIGASIRWYRDAYIDECIRLNPTYTAEQVELYVKSKEIDNNWIDEKLREFWEKVDIREAQSNIHIKDYLESHFYDLQLFYDTEHPSKEVLGEIGNRILTFLNMKRLPDDVFISNVYAHEVPVYPQIKKYLKLNWKERDLKKDNCAEKIENVYMDFKEYIRQYLIAYSSKNNIVYLSGKVFLNDHTVNEIGKWVTMDKNSVWGAESKAQKMYAISINDNEYAKLEYQVKGNISGWSEVKMSGALAGKTDDPDDYIVDMRVKCFIADPSITMRIRGYFQSIGWKEFVEQNECLGNNNIEKRLEAFEIYLENTKHPN